MRVRLTALAATVVAAGLGMFGTTTAHADACNNDGSDPQNVIIGPASDPILRVGVDDPLTGYPGVVVVCVGIGESETTQAGGGVYVHTGPGGELVLTPTLCLPDCDWIP